MSIAERNKSVLSYAFRGLLILSVIHIMILPLGNRTIKIIFCALELLLLLLISIYRIVCYPVRISDLGNIMIVSSIMLFNYIWYSIGSSFDTIVSMVCLFSFLLGIMTSDIVQIDDGMMRFLRGYSIFLSVVCIIYAMLPFSHLYNGNEIKALTLGFTNPNLTGIYLLLIFCLLLVLSFYKKSIVIFILQAAILYLIFQTGARASSVTALFLVALALFVKYRIPTKVVVGCCITPFVFVFVYIWLYRTDFNPVILGKDLFSGRQFVYEDYLQKLNCVREYLFGSFERDIIANAHNAPLAIFTSIGLVGLICMYSIIIGKLVRTTPKINERYTQIALYVILACFIQSSGEAFLFLGEFPGSIFMYLFFVLLNGSTIVNREGEAC